MTEIENFVQRSSKAMTVIRLHGWELVLSRDPLPDGSSMWKFSARLHPYGRSSTESDWEQLGRFLALVQSEIGAKDEPRGLSQYADPNDVQHFVWFVPKEDARDSVAP